MQANIKMQPKTFRIFQIDFQSTQTVKPGSTLYCDAGILWVTQAGDRQDYILTSGQKMKVSKRGKVVVEAMRDADFHVA